MQSAVDAWTIPYSVSRMTLSNFSWLNYEATFFVECFIALHHQNHLYLPSSNPHSKRSPQQTNLISFVGWFQHWSTQPWPSFAVTSSLHLRQAESSLSGLWANQIYNFHWHSYWPCLPLCPIYADILYDRTSGWFWSLFVASWSMLVPTSQEEGWSVV